MSHIEFLLDENVLGLARFLENSVKYKKVGDNDTPAKEAEDHEIVKFSKENNLVIVTRDIKMIEQCKLANVKYVTYDDVDFAKRVIKYPN